MKVRKMRGGYESPTGKLYEFVMAECECCNIEGMLMQTLEKTNTLMGAKKVYTIRPPTIFYKEDEDGLQYDAMCGMCIEDNHDTHAKEASAES